MPTLFTKIIERSLSAYVVAEDDNHIAFLDIAPIAHGHTLAVLKKEMDYIFDLNDTTLSNLMVFAKQVAVGLRKVVPCKRIGMCVLGLEVPHVHIHLVPIQSEEDLNLSGKRIVPTTPDELEKLQHRLQAAVQGDVSK